jgi:RNA polymerase sigma factor (TIGR02999 family)
LRRYAVRTNEQVTRLLQRWKLNGDSEAEEELFALVEGELLRIARRALARDSGFDHKIDARELVNEAYLALRDYPIATSNRAPFFVLMAKAMRNFLMDLARHDRAAKRPQTRLRVIDTGALNAVPVSSDVGPLEFYESLDALREIEPRQAETIELRVVGLGNDEIAEAQQVSLSTVKRDMAEARAFLAFRLGLPADWIQP